MLIFAKTDLSWQRSRRSSTRARANEERPAEVVLGQAAAGDERLWVAERPAPAVEPERSP
jgi:hypothetical protein